MRNVKMSVRFRILILFLVFMTPIFGSAKEAEGETRKLKVLCYNLRFGELASLEELAAFIRSVDPDIVALQEVDVMTYRERAPHQNGKNFIAELGYHTGMLSAYARTIDYAKGYYGIGILSKYPFASTRKILLPLVAGSKEQRAMLVADVELPGNKVFTFVSTHLDHTNGEVRQAQAKTLNKALKGNPHPMIVAGDFNARPKSPEISEGMKKWNTACNSDFTIPATGPRSKIDYIFYAPAGKWKPVSSETPRVTLSDHLPLWAELELMF
jgi:endonuclease/exonuclease/phosphatase family metal-dependent hydrolase